ncbi:helix-turn-helix transcriptional regulator [Marinobacter fonticola]|uniref:helix-turn-helix transcriptional regulator n=1 Tax=Marinobacter fonticola TaxID=2603215 RepID=UPI0011E7F6FF|nr:YafY family protein [Marinobacter fonticola]
MSGPTTRVLAALELLQSHRQIGGGELAERLGVDRRTVRRYISVLEELGIPVTTEQGRYGGYSLVAGFKLPPMMFTDEETLAIALGLLTARQLGLAAYAPAIAGVEAKLERVMPEKLKRRVRAVRDTTRVILPRGEPSLDDNALLTLTHAAEDSQRVAFRYHSPELGMMDRAIDPYGAVFRQGRWYVIGFCHRRQAMRSFRLDRIDRVVAQPETFQRPPGFDPAEFLQDSLSSWGQAYEVSVLLHTDRKTLAAMGTFMPECTGPFESHEDGLLLNTHTDSLQWFAGWLAQLPIRFTVLAPEGLKQALRRHAQQLMTACGPD